MLLFVYGPETWYKAPGSAQISVLQPTSRLSNYVRDTWFWYSLLGKKRSLNLVKISSLEMFY